MDQQLINLENKFILSAKVKQTLSCINKSFEILGEWTDPFSFQHKHKNSILRKNIWPRRNSESTLLYKYFLCETSNYAKSEINLYSLSATIINRSELSESGSKNRKKKGHTKKETFIHLAIHHNWCYGEANFHKAAKLIEADQICFTSLHSFKMAISLPISRAFTVPHPPGSGWELARLSWMKHSNSSVLPWNSPISL